MIRAEFGPFQGDLRESTYPGDPPLRRYVKKRTCDGHDVVVFHHVILNCASERLEFRFAVLAAHGKGNDGKSSALT